MFKFLLASLLIASTASALVLSQTAFERHANLTTREGTGSDLPVSRIYGVNLGSWFVFEPYMAVSRWQSMGGDALCDPCQNCVNDEFRLTKKLGQSAANTVFKNHWNTWITQDDVNLMVQYGINSVRIPIGFWIIESTVISGEYYPQGGLDYLRKGCKMFAQAGISVLLDFHAAPGAQVSSNSFAGRCTSTPQFWQQSNFDRLNAAVKKLATLVHTETDNFGSVFAIQALNEPPVDGNQTPGYGNFLQQFVSTVRNVESSLGIPSNRALSTAFMDVSWQWLNNQVNPASYAKGVKFFDTHLYYTFGTPCGPNGCVQNTQDSHVDFACSGGGGRLQDDTNRGNSPLVLGEWWLQAPDSVASYTDKAFYKRFGDAQKLGFPRGYYFWSWKMTNSGDLNTLRSYKDAVAKGYLPSKASAYFDSNTCSY